MKHEAIIQGNVYRKIHSYDSYTVGSSFLTHENYRVVESMEFVREELLWEGCLESPLLEPGEILCIEELRTEVVIKSRKRSTNGNVIYSTHHQLKVIEDEKTYESLKYAEEMEIKRKQWEQEFNKQEKLTWWEKLFR